MSKIIRSELLLALGNVIAGAGREYVSAIELDAGRLAECLEGARNRAPFSPVNSTNHEERWIAAAHRSDRALRNRPSLNAGQVAAE